MIELRIRISGTNGRTREVRVDGRSLTIGRDPSCEIVLRQDEEDTEDVVSRRHASIEVLDGYVQLVDLKSTNGTFLNGIRVSAAVDIAAGDRIGLGDPGPVLEVLQLEGGSSRGRTPMDGPARAAADLSSPFSSSAAGASSQASAAGADAPKRQSTRELLINVQEKHARQWRWAVGIGGAILLLFFVVLLVALNPFGGSYRDTADLVEAVRDSVVRIEVRTPDGTGVGTAFLIDEDGLIITNYHVIESAQDAKVFLDDDRSVPVEGFIFADKAHDLAALKISSSGRLPRPLRLADKLPRAGVRVIAIGFPKDIPESVAAGIVSSTLKGTEARQLLLRAIKSELPLGDGELADLALDAIVSQSGNSLLDGSGDNVTWIKTDADITHGNSGGPLIDDQKTVVGVNTWGHDEPGFNFACSAHHILKLLDEYPDHKVRPLSELP